VSDPLPITIELFFSNLTIASPIASMPSVTASILHSFRVTLISISLSIALYIASTGPVPVDVASSILLFELFFILIFAFGCFSEPDSILTEIKQFSNGLSVVSESFSSFTSSASSLDSSMKTLQGIVDGLDQGEGTLGKLLKDDTLYENMNEVVTDARDLINDVKENPTKYVKAYWKGRQ